MNEKVKKRIKATRLFHAYDKHRTEKNYFSSYEASRKMISEQSVSEFIKSIWMHCMHCELNLDNPQTFNEKLQWLKLNWYDERARVRADKNLSREYVKSMGLEDMLVPQIAVYDRPEDIDISKLPEKFVLKPSHDSGHTFICTDKSKFNIKKVRKILEKHLDVDYEFMSGEWVYATPHKSIVCEKYLESNNGKEITDYKFYCFNGEPKFLYTSYGQYTSGGIKMDFYDLDWNLLSFRRLHYPNGNINKKKPECFQKLVDYARKMSEGFPFIRIDFMENNDKFYFGEFTFFPGGGLDPWQPNSVDKDFGDMLILPPKSNPSPWDIIHPELSGEKK